MRKSVEIRTICRIETNCNYLIQFVIGALLVFVGNLNAQENVLNNGLYTQSIITEGIKINFVMEHVDQNKDPHVFSQNDDVIFRFEILDTLAGKGISGAAPAAWMEPSENPDDGIPESCGQKITSFLSGSIFNRAELDLNVFYVLVMNDDASLTVVDPLFSFGGSQLLAYIELESIASDWVIAKDQLHVYVSMPQVEKIAVINTSNWTVEKTIPMNAKVYELEMQKDEAYLWASFDSKRIEGFSGVSVIPTETNNVKATIPTGSGNHQIILSDDSRFAFVSNSISKTISVIDVSSLKKVKDINISGKITSMAWSSKAKALYSIDSKGGIISVIDADSHEVISEVQGKPGISSIKFDPTGRFGFILGKENSIVQIIDAASNRIVQNGTTESKPIEVVFSDELAYVLHEESETILMFPLDVIGIEGGQLQAADFPGGQYPPGKIENRSFGELMVQAPGANAMLIANNLDKTIYYYMEGMAAPMGNFSNYSKKPRAVEVIDRSLEERKPGVYETVGKIRGSGNYDIAFFVDVPRIIHCFSVPVVPDAATLAEINAKRVGALSVLHPRKTTIAKSGDLFSMNFMLVDKNTNKAVGGLKDVRVRGIAPGNWFKEGSAQESESEGVYQYNIEFKKPGIYYLYVECLSRKLNFNNPQYLIVKVI